MVISPIAETAESLETPMRILHLLERVRSAGHVLLAAPPGSDEVWRTTISRINKDRSQIVYQQLMPSSWREADLSRALEIHCLEPGTRLTYQAVLRPIEDGGIAYFESRLPAVLRYHQPRKLFRVDVPSLRSGITIRHDQGEWEGALLDVSEGGCRARLELAAGDLRRGQCYEQCRVWIDDILDINCQIEVCHMRKIGRYQEVGLTFQSLPLADGQQLQRGIVELQRANLRRGIAQSA